MKQIKDKEDRQHMCIFLHDQVLHMLLAMVQAKLNDAGHILLHLSIVIQNIYLRTNESIALTYDTFRVKQTHQSVTE